MINNNCRRDRCNPCDDTVECKKPTSILVYDGCDLPMWGIRNGDSLNSVLENAYRSFKKLSDSTEPIYIEHFKNPSLVHLSIKPTEVLMVTYCGGVVPTDDWCAVGQEIQFSSAICTDQASEVSVIYKAPAENLFNINCVL